MSTKELLLANNSYGFFNPQILKDYLASQGFNQVWKFPDDFDSWMYVVDVTGKEEDEVYRYKYISNLSRHHNHHYRYDPEFMAFVKTYNSQALAQEDGLRIITIPNDVKYRIEEGSDGEYVQEIGRIWK